MSFGGILGMVGKCYPHNLFSECFRVRLLLHRYKNL
jgi:hypothetical protein